jgi:heptaprenyl diphosphate synthase
LKIHKEIYFGEARVMKMQNIRQKYTDIKEKLEKRVFDTYLLKYIEKPMIDEDKLLILISMMDALEVPLRKVENYCLAAMLIQIALDTHEHINKLSKDGKMRQLTVLAGDYYSGLYYKILAESEDIVLIKAISAGVKEINEHKVVVYRQDSEDIEKLMASMKLIESSILMKISDHFNMDFWSDFLGNLLFFKRLLKEKSKFTRGENSVLFDAMKKVLFPIRLSSLLAEQNQQLLMVCDHYLELSKQAIENGVLMSSHINDLLAARISSLLKQYQPIAKTFVEEG